MKLNRKGNVLAVFELIKNVVITLVAIGTFEHGKKAIYQWLREKRGTDKYKLGRKLLLKIFGISDKLLQARSLSEFLKYIDANKEGWQKGRHFYESIVFEFGKVAEKITELKVLNLEARIFKINFKKEIDELSRINALMQSSIYTFEHSTEDKDLQQKALLILSGGALRNSDEHGKSLNTATEKMTKTIREKLLVQGFQD